MKSLLAVVLVVLASVPAAQGMEPPPVPEGAWLPDAAAQRKAVAELLRRDEPVYCGGPRGNAVALTFDDGPGPYTRRVVSVLRAHGARATFFLVGNRIQWWPSAGRDELSVGAVGNHTWSHPPLTERRGWLVWLELLRTQYVLRQGVGTLPTLLRLPYGRHSARVDAIARGLGLLEVFWDVDGRDDVPNPTVESIVRNVVSGLRPGAIVELHDIHPWTLRALPRILAALRARGLRAVTVPELLALDPPAPHQGCPYSAVGSGD